MFSGRFESWRLLARFLGEHPWHALFGIGYKTLPYSTYLGRTVIADNMYLSMLVETGVIGLAALVTIATAGREPVLAAAAFLHDAIEKANVEPGQIRDAFDTLYVEGEEYFYYLTLYNENYEMPGMPDGAEPGEGTELGGR